MILVIVSIHAIRYYSTYGRMPVLMVFIQFKYLYKDPPFDDILFDDCFIDCNSSDLVFFMLFLYV